MTATEETRPARVRDQPGALPPHRRVAGRYEVIRYLKQGDGVETSLGLDLTNDQQVVLKSVVLSHVHPSVRLRFEHETRVLRQLSGSGLSMLYDAGQTDDQLYLVQRFVPGVTLEAMLRDGPVDVLNALRIGLAVAGALEVAHAAGVYHRDVKPANIIVDASATERDQPDVTLIDFGLSRSPWLSDSIRDDLVGTVRYLAPESAGLLSSPADERSDLYAVGVVLYECVAGQTPFLGPSVSDLLRQHSSTPAPDLRTTSRAVPRAVAATVARLLRKDPAERYQSATALVADLSQILTAIESGDADPAIVIGRHDRRRVLTDPAFVGRERDLRILADFVAGVSEDRGGIALVEADSGGGKSRLLTEVVELAGEAGVCVLHGQGVALAGQRPFTLLHGVADDLIHLFAPDPDAGATLARRVADVAPAIVRALPALEPLLETASAKETGPEQFGELRSLLGLRRLLAAAAAEQRPLLLILDDCQWADTLTVRLLADLFTQDADTPHYLGVIAAFRSEEVAGDHPLRAIQDAQSVRLGPLSGRSVGLLAESMAGPLPTRAIEIVVRLADGNPFTAAAVLRGLVESDALVAQPEGWVIDEARLPEAQAARRSAAFLVRRLELLSTDALELLSAGAVLGKTFEVDRAVRIIGRSEGAEQILADARRRRLVWLDDSAGTCVFFHDKIRESLIERLDEDTRRALHGRAADDLASEHGDYTGDEMVFDLAYHLDASGRPADALPYALAAAELARGRYALDAAVTHYRMAAAAVDPSDSATTLRVNEALGDVLTLQGSYGEAGRRLSDARSVVTEASHAADLDSKLGALAFKQGDIPTAKAHLEGALARLGRRVPHRALMLPRVLWEILVQAAHTLLPRLTTGRRADVGHDDDFLAMRVYSRLAYLYWFHSGKVNCAWSHLRGMNLAERYGPSAELGQAWSEHAPVMTMLPWYARGVRYAERSMEIRRDLGDIWGEGQSLNFTGVAQYAASRFDLAEHACEEAIRMLRRTGDQWEVNTASWNLAACLLRKGELGRTVEVARSTFESAMEIGDQTAAGISLSIWTRAVGGRIPADLVRDRLAAGSEDAQTTTELHLADALAHRATGDLDAAATSIRRAVTTIRDAGLRQEYIAPVFTWRATILRELAESTPAHCPALRRTRIRTAAAAARSARRWAFSYRNNAPHALRESALIASLRGRARRAQRLLSRSLDIADAQGARYEAAHTRLVMAEIHAARTGDTEQRDYAAAVVKSFDPVTDVTTDAEPTSLSLFERFSGLLHAARAIASATSEAALGAAVRDAALSLLRAERCRIIQLSSLADDGLSSQSSEELEGISRTLLLRAAAEGVPVIPVDELAADSNDSLVLSGIRSALAAPIFVQGQVTSFLYVTHRQLGEFFGEEEIQLAAFLSTLAGAAYEHLAGNETRFHSLAQSSSDVITLVDAEGVVSYQSAAVRRVFGLSSSGLIGFPITNWVHPDDVDRFQAMLASVAAADEGRIECRFLHADGTFRFAESAVTNLLHEPTVAALVLNTRDVTDRQRFEQELLEKNEELEKVGLAKDTFLASMSHELRTPLNAIIGFTGTLLMRLPGPLNSDQEHQLQTVERSGKHLLAIINDLLDMAKIESGEVRLVLEDVNCNEVLRSVTAALQPLADEKGLTLFVATPDENVVLRSDERALGQILINLVSNAIKFTDSGGVTVHLLAYPHSGRRCITVSDTGPGIPEEDLVSIFDAFERGKDGIRTSKEGTGLGLHISRKLGELIGAGVSVESRLGVGSTFTVTLDESASPFEVTA